MLRSCAAIPFLFASAAAMAAPPLAPADQVAAFKAAGFMLKGKQWRTDCEDPDSASYTPGTLEEVKDLNGDGLPEAVITEGSAYCYGNTGTAFVLVSKQPGGAWKRMTGEIGMASFLATKGVGGWPDIEIGGPGFCFPIERWNGKAYVQVRYAYEGKACKPGG